jgi:hypothetical protein
MKVQVKFLRGKVVRGEKVFLLFLPLATKIGTFQGPPNIGTFHWPPSWDLPSFSFSLKRQIQIIWSFFLERTILDSNLENHLFTQPSLGGKEWFFLVDGRKKESRMDICNSFERMDGVGIMLGA